MSDLPLPSRHRPRPERGAVDARDIVTSGCGRVYVFPPDLPSFRREAGLDHYSYRVGYVERHDELWVPRDFGNHRLGFGSRSRTEAVRRVVEDAGWIITGYPDGDTLIPLRIPVMLGDGRNQVTGEVVLDYEGLVHVAQRIEQTGLRVLETLGAVWTSGARVVALRYGAVSQARTIHYSRTDAVHALIAPSAYARIPNRQQRRDR